MIPLENLVKKIKSENTWITTTEEISNYWIQLGKFQLNINEEESNRVTIRFNGPKDALLSGFTLKLNAKPAKIKINKGSYELVEKHQQVYLVVDAFAGQEVSLVF
jgi:hypothetical protein